MRITLEELVAGKATKIKNNEYFPTAAYVEPFLEKMSKFTNDFRVEVKLPNQITTTQTGEINTDDITYNRVWVQAVMPEELKFDNHCEVIGLVYGLDVRKPVVKLYRGGLNLACTNLCIFSPSFLNIQEINPGSTIDFRPIDYILEQTCDIKSWLDKLHNIKFECTPQNINNNLGKWIRNTISDSYNSGFGKVKIASSIPIDVYKSLCVDENSPYYVGIDNSTDMFNIYNAFTQLITNDGGRDIINKCEKTLLLKSILDLV